MSNDLYLAWLRNERNRRLLDSDWSQIPDATVDREAWAAYRQALRELPNQYVPGVETEFPTPPRNTIPSIESDTSEQSAEPSLEEGSSDDLTDGSSGPDLG